MTKREAKRYVAAGTADVLHDAVSSYQEWLTHSDTNEELSCDDRDRIADAVQELIDELDRRGGR